MPYVGTRETKQLTLPSNPDYWVKVYTSLKYGDIKKFSVDDQGNVAGQADILLENLIAEWNLDDASGVLPITQENIDQLDRKDVELIVREIGGTIDEDAKKNSSSESSSPSTEVAQPQES